MIFLFNLGQPLTPYAAAVVMPLAPASIHRLYTNEGSKISTNKNYPQLASIPPSKVDKIRLTNEQIKQFDILAQQLSRGSITIEEAILQLRGGDDLTDVIGVIAFVIFINWYDSLFGVEAFQSNPLPHQDPFGWFNGKYDSRNAGNPQCQSNLPSRFERETLHTMKQMCAASADENGFVMNYDEAYNLIKETYQGSLQITNEQSIDYWQACKKIYHAIDFGINPENYGMSQKQLMKINDPGGLIRYVQEDNRLPPIEFVQKFASTIKDSCLNEKAFKNEEGSYKVKGIDKPAVIFSIEATREKITFDKETGSFVSGQRVRLKSFNNYIGSIKNYPRQN